MASLIHQLLGNPWLKKIARGGSDWIDLQWSLTIQSLTNIAPRARGRLLDVGCGDKAYEPIFRPFVSEYLGIEHEATFAATSAEKRERKPDLYYDGKRLPFDDRTFDTVLSIQVLEHTPAPAALVAEMARVLKDDGLMIITAPFSFRLHEEPHDYFRYSPHGLKQLCADAGLVIDYSEQQGSLWSVVGHKINSYLALRVAHLDAVAQAMGKLGHEGESVQSPRWWTMPMVGPTMAAVALGARVLDQALHDPNEALGFLVVARRG
jgi:SAM-dependent methyltransferase